MSASRVPFLPRANAVLSSHRPAGASGSSVRSAQRNPSLFFGFERFPLKTAGFIDQLLDPLLCLFEARPAGCGKGVTALKIFERRFQRLFAFFHTLDDGFKLLQRLFKVRDFLVLLNGPRRFLKGKGRPGLALVAPDDQDNKTAGWKHFRSIIRFV